LCSSRPLRARATMETSERAARGDLPDKRCAKPGNRVMNMRHVESRRGSHWLVATLFSLNPSWEEEAEACSAAGRGREGVETVSERASW
jgi:hypothetical protein